MPKFLHGFMLEGIYACDLKKIKSSMCFTGDLRVPHLQTVNGFDPFAVSVITDSYIMGHSLCHLLIMILQYTLC